MDVSVSGEGLGGGVEAEDGKYTGVRGGGERERKEARKRSDVRYRQQRDAGDTTSDGERWEVTGGVGEERRGRGGARRWSSGVQRVEEEG